MPCNNSITLVIELFWNRKFQQESKPHFPNAWIYNPTCLLVSLLYIVIPSITCCYSTDSAYFRYMVYNFIVSSFLGLWVPTCKLSAVNMWCGCAQFCSLFMVYLWSIYGLFTVYFRSKLYIYIYSVLLIIAMKQNVSSLIRPLYNFLRSCNKEGCSLVQDLLFPYSTY